MAITSQFNAELNFGEMAITDYEKVGLLKPSVIKPVITTIEKSLVIRKLGQLKNSDSQYLQYLIKLILG